MSSNPIQWFPGHMAKTRRLMQESLSQVDLVLELLDARIPYSSKNPEIEKLLGTKPKIAVLTKSALANPDITRDWVEYDIKVKRRKKVWFLWSHYVPHKMRARKSGEYNVVLKEPKKE